MIVGVGVGPGKAVTVEVLGGQEGLEPLLFVCASSRRRPVLRLGWFVLRPRLSFALGRPAILRLVAGLNIKGRSFGACQHGPRPLGQEKTHLLDQLVDLCNSLHVLLPRDDRGCVLARAIGEVVKLHPPVMRVTIPLLVLLLGPMRGVPGYEKAVPLLPNVLPDVGVGSAKGAVACLEDGGAAVSCDFNLARRETEEKGESQGFTLDHTRPRGQHLGDAPNFSRKALVEGTGKHSSHDRSRATVVGGARGVSAKNKTLSTDRGALAPDSRLAGQQKLRRKGRKGGVAGGRQASNPQRLGRPFLLELMPVGRRGGPPSTPPPTLEQDMPQVGMLLAQWAAALGPLRSGEESTLPHHAQGCERSGALGLLSEQLLGY